MGAGKTDAVSHAGSIVAMHNHRAHRQNGYDIFIAATHPSGVLSALPWFMNM